MPLICLPLLKEYDVDCGVAISLRLIFKFSEYFKWFGCAINSSARIHTSETPRLVILI